MLSHSDLIQNIVELCGYKSYLELGLYRAETFVRIAQIVDNAVGVDNDNTWFPCAGRCYELTTDEFFKINEEQFDVIFIDACHDYEQVKKDFDSALEVLNPGGVIVLHDTDPASTFYARPGYCSDAYKIKDYFNSITGLNHITLPIRECGITLVRRKGEARL